MENEFSGRHKLVLLSEYSNMDNIIGMFTYINVEKQEIAGMMDVANFVF